MCRDTSDVIKLLSASSDDFIKDNKCSYQKSYGGLLLRCLMVKSFSKILKHTRRTRDFVETLLKLLPHPHEASVAAVRAVTQHFPHRNPNPTMGKPELMNINYVV